MRGFHATIWYSLVSPVRSWKRMTGRAGPSQPQSRERRDRAAKGFSLLWTSACGAVCVTVGEVYRLDPGRGCLRLPEGFDLQKRLVVSLPGDAPTALAGDPGRRLRNYHGTRCLSMIMPRCGLRCPIHSPANLSACVVGGGHRAHPHAEMSVPAQDANCETQVAAYSGPGRGEQRQGSSDDAIPHHP